jgi:nucleoside-diphosphate-sugar epimerase
MILVTGGTGLVGSHLLYNLLNKGFKVKVLVRPTSNKENIYRTFSYYTAEPRKLAENITWVEGDITDLSSLEDAFVDVDKVYHTAAYVSFRKKNKRQMFRTNIKGTANLVNLCMENGIKKLCHVSSIGALGESEPDLPVTEDLLWKPSKRVSAYSLSKYLSEMEVWRGITEGLNAVIVNPSVILGPGDWNNGTPAFFRLIDKGFPYYTNGVTGYVDVRDLVEVMVQLMDNEYAGERYTVSSENLTYRQFFDLIAMALGKKMSYKYVTKWKSSVIWQSEAILSVLFNREPKITRETAHIANAVSYYSSDKVKSVLHYNFRSIEQSVNEIAQCYKRVNK